MPDIKIGSKTFTDVENISIPLTDGTGQASFGSSGAPENIEWHQCPELVCRFVFDVTYDPNDYSTSRITEYAPSSPMVSNYKPIGKTVGDKTFYNEVPNTETPYQTGGKYGTVKPLDQVRYLNTPSAPNLRDLGGWACDGGTVKYGLLYRGGEPSAADREVLVTELGIRHDLNLRGSSEATWTVSPLGENIYFTKADNYNWYSAKVNDAWRTNLRCVFDAVTHGEPVFFHCAAGADRTGTLACVLEGLLGMSQSDIDKDYELTCFYSGAGTDNQARRRNEAEWTGLINGINAYDGDTFRDKCVTFAAKLGFTADEINAYRKAMIDGSPDEVTPNIATYSVVNTLTNATTSNDDATATEYQPYKADITVPFGYAIDSIKVMMGGKDITPQVFSGSVTNLRRAVNATAANCTVSGKKAVIDGQDFVATVTADPGYDIDTVTIKMGGIDVSAFYSNGKIAIPNVTGDIEIIATAIESAVEYTNQIAISTDGNGVVFNEKGYIENKRLNSTGVLSDLENTDSFNPIVTGYIPIKAGDVLRFKNAYILSCDLATLKSCGYIDTDGTVGTTRLFPLTSYNVKNIESIKTAFNAQIADVGMAYDGVVEMTIPDDTQLTNSSGQLAKYMRFSLERPNSEAIPIITINEEID